jgi:hypothetical protein
MSQATLLGLCSDNVVTILQPSSTIECLNYGNGVYVDISSNTVSPITPPATVSIPLPGAAFIHGSVTITGPTTVTIGGSTFTGTSPATTLPFQAFVNGSSTILSISGSATGYTYSIATLS